MFAPSLGKHERRGASRRMQDGDAHPAPCADGMEVCAGLRERVLLFVAV